MKKNRPILVMGVSGCGKSTLARALAEKLDRPFYDADDYHPETSVAKMRSGTPLNDADRMPWLDRLNNLLRDDPTAILACSALKRAYRQRLRDGLDPAPRFVHLVADVDLLRARLRDRDHFMPPALLQSQFDALEAPTTDEALRLDATLELAELVKRVVQS